MKNPITSGQVAQFATWVKTYQQALNLNDWRIIVSAKRAKGPVLAEVVQCDVEARLATIQVGQSWYGEPMDPDPVPGLALHEVCHILCREMCDTYADPRATPEQRMSAEHRVVNTILTLVRGQA